MIASNLYSYYISSYIFHVIHHFHHCILYIIIIITIYIVACSLLLIARSKKRSVAGDHDSNGAICRDGSSGASDQHIPIANSNSGDIDIESDDDNYIMWDKMVTLDELDKCAWQFSDDGDTDSEPDLPTDEVLLERAWFFDESDGDPDLVTVE